MEMACGYEHVADVANMEMACSCELVPKLGSLGIIE